MTTTIQTPNYVAQNSLQARLATFYAQPQSQNIEPEAAIEHTLTPEMEQALAVLDSNTPAVFLTGRAGTGKSTLLRKFIASTKRNIAVVAPTGIAALNVGGQTIHAFFRFPAQNLTPSMLGKLSDTALYEELDTVIIDEASMLRADILDCIDTFLRLNGPSKKQPFGGVRIILVGDLFQLPPVVTTEDKEKLAAIGYTEFFFFAAKVWQTVPLQMVELSRVFRQDDSHFLSLLEGARNAKLDSHTLHKLNAGCTLQKNDHTITLTTRNDTAERINNQRLNAINSPASNYNGKIEGIFNTSILPVPLSVSFKVGARVMLAKNLLQRGLANGMTGVVTRLTEKEVYVKFDDAKNEVHITTETWNNYKYTLNPITKKIDKVIIGSYHQIPLVLGWAMTIHKSQGKTFSQVQLDLEGGCFAEGQLYTALSRCRSHNGIALARPIRLQDQRTNPRVVQFMHLMRQSY